GLSLTEASNLVHTRVRKILGEGNYFVTLSGWRSDWRRLDELDAPNPPPQSAGDKIPREDLRYAGKTFEQWKRDLLTELKPEIRIDGINAMREFGGNGYGKEATEVILEIARGMDSDQSSAGASGVERACHQAIRRIGEPATPALLRAIS